MRNIIYNKQFLDHKDILSVKKSLLQSKITTGPLVEAFEKEGHSIDKKFVTITGGNIKRLGQYNAVIRLHRDVTFDFPFEVIAQA